MKPAAGVDSFTGTIIEGGFRSPETMSGTGVLGRSRKFRGRL